MLFSDENIFITLSYVLTAVLFTALAAHSILRARATRKTIQKLSQERANLEGEL